MNAAEVAGWITVVVLLIVGIGGCAALGSYMIRTDRGDQ